MPAAQRIAFVCPRFPEGSTTGGAETLLRSLAERLAGLGRSVTFLTTCARDHFTWQNVIPPGPRRIGNVNVMFFPVDEDRDVETFLRVQSAICRRAPVAEEDERLWLANSVNSRALCRHLEERGAEYDVIIAGPYLFGLVYHASRIHPAKTILVPCLHDEPFAYLASIRRMFQGADRIMFNAGPERDLALRLYGIRPEKTSVVGMGIPDFEADPSAFARKRRIGAPYVIYSGRREPLKGTPMLLDYLAAFRDRTQEDVKLVLTGTGRIDVPAGLESHVLDAGFLSEQDKHEAMAGATAFCHPSMNESFSIVILESWLARTPVIVQARSAVMREHCRKSGGGLWFMTYPEFEEELLLLLRDATLRRTLGENGRRYVLQEYAWPEIERKLLAAVDRAW